MRNPMHFLVYETDAPTDPARLGGPREASRVPHGGGKRLRAREWELASGVVCVGGKASSLAGSMQ